MTDFKYRHETIESLKIALECGEYKDKYVEIIIDSSSIPAKAWPLDKHGKPDFDNEPEYLANFAVNCKAGEALRQALLLLGFQNVEFA